MSQLQNINFQKDYLSNAELIEYLDIKIVFGFKAIKEKGILPIVAVWKGRQGKPFSRFYYKSIAEAKNNIHRFKRAAEIRKESKAKIAADKKAYTPEFEVGDIYVASWGYEQTNVDAFQIIKKVSKHYAIIKAIAIETVENSQGNMSDKVMPVKDKFISCHRIDNDGERKKVTQHGIKIFSFSNAYKWDGKRSFYRSWYY